MHIASYTFIAKVKNSAVYADTICIMVKVRILCSKGDKRIELLQGEECPFNLLGSSKIVKSYNRNTGI